jgi:flagellar biosynthesis GTPase FlhF
MAELEADRPLWEEAARKRAAREAEEQRRRAAEQRARLAQEEAARRAQKEEEERREAERAAAEQQAERSSVRRRREQMRTDVLRPYKSRFTVWSNYDAVDRFMKLSDAFDKLNFHRGDLIIFEIIPWPMLNKPGTFGVGEIEWQAVERFFSFARSAITPANFKVVVDKTHKRFHPDRWRSRRVLACIDDEEEKECLEMAANTVAQALTPLWKEVTGR